MADKNVSMKQKNAPVNENRNIQNSNQSDLSNLNQEVLDSSNVNVPINPNVKMENASIRDASNSNENISNAEQNVKEPTSLTTQTVIQPNDFNALIEEEATAAGLTSGDGEGGGHSFVDINRIVEVVPTASYDFPLNPTGVPPTITGESVLVQPTVTSVNAPEEPVIPNTLVDDNEFAQGLFNTTINGNLLDNTERQVGETYSVTEFIINGVTYTSGSSVNIADVGTIIVNTNGDWSFTPNDGYEGPVPVVNYQVFDGDLYDNSTLTISEIRDLTPSILPTVSVDLEVDPGMEKLVGNYTNADTVFVSISGSDGSSQGYMATLYNGNWSVDLTSVIFSEDVIYTANAIATNKYGIANASDIDSYTIIEPPNTLLDGDETAIGLFNTTISGNLLDNTEKQAGETYSVTQFTIDGITYQASNSALIEGVGTITVNENGDWLFTPNHGYEGPVPIVEYKVYDGDLYDDSKLTITDISTTPIEYNFGNWFIAQLGNNNTTQYYTLVEGDNQKATQDFEVQVQGQSDPIPNGAYIQVTFDISGTATVGDDFTLSVDSKFYDVIYTVEDEQLIVNLSGGSGPLNGLPFSVTVEAVGDNDISSETLTMDISNVKLLLEDGRELTTGAWESNDSINFNIVSPVTEVAATANIDIMGNTTSYGAEVFSWDVKSIENQQDLVLSFNKGDKLDFSDLLSKQDHQVNFDVTESESGTLVTVTDVAVGDTTIQEILLSDYFAPDIPKMVNDLRNTGSYSG